MHPQRTARLLQFDADVKKTPHSNAVIKGGVVLSPAEQAHADAVQVLTSAIEAVHRQVERAEAAVELAA